MKNHGTEISENKIPEYWLQSKDKYLSSHFLMIGNIIMYEYE